MQDNKGVWQVHKKITIANGSQCKMLEHNKAIIKIGWEVRGRKQTIRLAASNKESRTWKS